MSDASSMRQPRRWPFYVSLFINGVLITVVAFGLWRIHQVRENFRAMRDRPAAAWMPEQVAKALPEASRPKVDAIREKHKDAFKPLFEASRAARDALIKTFDAEPFDAAAVRAALAATRQADAAVGEATGEMMVEIFQTLTPEERAMVRDAARKHRPRGGRKGLGGPDGPDGPPPGPGPEGGPMDDGMPPPPPPEGDQPPPPPAPN